MDPARIGEKDRTIRIGDTTVELTNQEISLGAVSYLYHADPHARVMERRHATPEEVLQTRFPDLAFQVSSDGYEVMTAKAKRIIALRSKHA